MANDPMRAAATEAEARFAAEHFSRNGVNRSSIYSLLERYFAAYDSMGEVRLPAPAGPAPPECAKGCAFCCHTIVVVTAPEAFYVADHIDRSADAQNKRQAVAAFDRIFRGRDGAVRWGAGTPCPQLDVSSGACTVYGARPLACRGLLSSSKASCQKAFDERAANVRSEGAAAFLFQNSDIFTFALAAGLRAHGHVLYRLEFNAALAAVWGAENAFQRWLSGEDIFRDARAPNADRPLA